MQLAMDGKKAISIHAAQEGCDPKAGERYLEVVDFNPRSPNGLRPRWFTKAAYLNLFQSTQPEWAATETFSSINSSLSYFNPRSPNGLRLINIMPERPDIIISIYAARVGCDRKSYIRFLPGRDLNPRSPSGLRPFRSECCWIL